MAEPITILYHDASVAVCRKPAGLDSQSAVPAALRESLGGDAFCVHRLDRDVGGLMVYARTAAAAAALGKAIAAGRLEKDYLAVCAGRPSPDAGSLRDLLFHDAQRNKTFVVTRQRRGVREALLDYTVLEALADCSLLRVRLRTGRSHQIRVQFAARGMPLLGDRKYGSRVSGCGIALWSAGLAFPHPDDGAPMRFTAPPPASEPWTRFSIGGADHA